MRSYESIFSFLSRCVSAVGSNRHVCVGRNGEGRGNILSRKRDGSGKPGEALCIGLVPYLQRTARRRPGACQKFPSLFPTLQACQPWKNLLFQPENTVPRPLIRLWDKSTLPRPWKMPSVTTTWHMLFCFAVREVWVKQPVPASLPRPSTARMFSPMVKPAIPVIPVFRSITERQWIFTNWMPHPITLWTI